MTCDRCKSKMIIVQPKINFTTHDPNYKDEEAGFYYCENCGRYIHGIDHEKNKEKGNGGK